MGLISASKPHDVYYYTKLKLKELAERFYDLSDDLRAMFIMVLVQMILITHVCNKIERDESYRKKVERGDELQISPDNVKYLFKSSRAAIDAIESLFTLRNSIGHKYYVPETMRALHLMCKNDVMLRELLMCMDIELQHKSAPAFNAAANLMLGE